MVKRALLIGINYKFSENELRGCIQDVNNIRDILVNNCGYNPNNICMLTDDTQTKPTRQNIENSISWLVSNCLPGDTIVFYYSGHGAFVNTQSQELSHGTEFIIPIDFTTSGANIISDDWLFDNLAAKVPQNVTLFAFADCCHSGTMLDLKYNFDSKCQLKSGTLRQGMPYNPQDWTDHFLFMLERSRDVVGNVYLFSGCQDNETSADAFEQGKYQGAFSYCLIECLKNNMQRMPDGTTRFKNGSIKLRNLLKDVNARLEINGFSGQDSQLSLSKQADFERTLDL